MFKGLIKLKRELARGLSRFGLETIRTNYNGLKLVVPMFRGVGRKLVVPDDPWMSRCLKRQLELKPGAVIDIGANAGIYLVKLRAMDETRQYIGFEPNSLCKYFISEVIRLNKFTRASCFPFALSNSDEVRMLYASTMDDAGASLFQENKQSESLAYSMEVVTRVGDEFLNLLNLKDGVSAIKIDVEGAELEVLEGLKETISRHKPTFYCEILGLSSIDDELYQQKRARLEALFSLLNVYNYCVFGAQPDGGLIRVDDVEAMSKSCRAEYMLLHRDDVDAFLAIFAAEKGIPVDAPI